MSARADYVTRPREWIASVLRREPRFLSATEIHDRLKSNGARVSLSTVYRTLERLLAKGDVSLRPDAEGEATYLRCEPERHHHHAICQNCGLVQDVDCDAMERFAESLRSRHGFELDGHAIEFFGRCEACR